MASPMLLDKLMWSKRVLRWLNNRVANEFSNKLFFTDVMAKITRS